MIRFSKYGILYFIISACVLVPGIVSMMFYGFAQSIDFTGGTRLEYRFPRDVAESVFTDAAKATSIPQPDVSRIGQGDYVIRTKPVTEDMIGAFEKDVAQRAGSAPNVVQRETVGPVLGKELLQKTVTAAIIAITAILLYVAYAFHDLRFGVSAVIALFHDVLVVFGVFSLLGHFWHVEVDTLFVTAFLTTMSFSVHDTIVIFDRIREYRKRDQKSDLATVSDIALTETMGRSLINSFTIIFMLLALVLMGGESVRWFAFALLVGTVTGTYSSPFVATPILLLWDRFDRGRSGRR